MSYNWNKIPRPVNVRSWETFKDHTFSHLSDVELYHEMMETQFNKMLGGSSEDIYNDEILIHIFRSTFLTQLFTLLEYNLRSICLNIQKFNYQSFSVLDLAGTSDIQKAQIYLKKTIEINIGEYSEWNFIKDCQKVRNNIVHKNSYFEKDIAVKENSDFEQLLSKLNSFKVISVAQDMAFKKIIKTFLIIDCELNKKLIESLGSLFDKIYNHIISFNKITTPEELAEWERLNN